MGHSVYPTKEYVDYSEEGYEWIAAQGSTLPKKTGGRAAVKFPAQLHCMLGNLEETGRSEIISWQPHGRAFKIHDRTRFEAEILPLFFTCQKEFSSFQRQLNIYGFLRLKGLGPDQSAYCALGTLIFYASIALILTLIFASFSDHQLFLRGRPELCHFLPRNRIAARNVRRTFDATTEPNFYKMAPVNARNSNSSCNRNMPDTAVQQPPAEMQPVLDYSAILTTDTTVSMLRNSMAQSTHPVSYPADNVPAAGNLTGAEAFDVAHPLAIGGFYPYGIPPSRTNPTLAAAMHRANNYDFQTHGGAFGALANDNSKNIADFYVAPTLSSVGVNCFSSPLFGVNTETAGTVQGASEHAYPRPDDIMVANQFNMICPIQFDFTANSFSRLDMSESSCADMGSWLEDVDLETSDDGGRRTGEDQF